MTHIEPSHRFDHILLTLTILWTQKFYGNWTRIYWTKENILKSKWTVSKKIKAQYAGLFYDLDNLSNTLHNNLKFIICDKLSFQMLFMENRGQLIFKVNVKISQIEQTKLEILDFKKSKNQNFYTNTYIDDDNKHNIFDVLYIRQLNGNKCCDNVKQLNTWKSERIIKQRIKWFYNWTF